MKFIPCGVLESKINKGQVLTQACSDAYGAALCDHIATEYKISVIHERSETPMGRDVIVFFFEPDSLIKARIIGEYLTPFNWSENKIYHEKELAALGLIEKWEKVFESFKTEERP
jgi:hypothetical protein